MDQATLLLPSSPAAAKMGNMPNGEGLWIYLNSCHNMQITIHNARGEEAELEKEFFNLSCSSHFSFCLILLNHWKICTLAHRATEKYCCEMTQKQAVGQELVASAPYDEDAVCGRSLCGLTHGRFVNNRNRSVVTLNHGSSPLFRCPITTFYRWTTTAKVCKFHLRSGWTV